MTHSFGAGEPFTVGSRRSCCWSTSETLRLDHVAERVLAGDGAAASERAGHEAFLAEIEVRSEPRRSAGRGGGRHRRGPRRDPRGRRHADGGRACTRTPRFGDVQLVDSERYAAWEEMRGLIKRTPECALHVHVGDARRRRRPSRGADGPARGAAADRRARRRLAVLVRAGLGAGERPRGGGPRLPGPRHPAAAARLGGLPARRSTAVALGGGPRDHTMVWWDARLQPRLGTVELRELDVQTRLDEAAGMAALVQALARRAAERPAASSRPPQALHWSSFRAVRDGLDAELLFRGRLRRPARPRGAARRAARRGRRARGRRAHPARGRRARRASERRSREGGMPALLRQLADETARRRLDDRPLLRAAVARGPGRPRWRLARPLRGAPPPLVAGERRRSAWLLELAHALAREAEPAAGLAQGLGLLAVEAEAQA